ncbi:Rhodanese-related sulfurtransferase [Roseateles sp. YR242]|uniref:rhodanese-like domain-containing protein n=1 Tax=Roseateles sp. YR242 TaxID=1855305 RepID=UPI0008AAC9BA|nr:rhodanese-like domain-containing protein [Roseateles sp. YR242]SEL17519.1 Rhodanese-related sulfurtransferase [Roseateles sp. YR242]
MQELNVQELQAWARQVPAPLLLDVREPWEVALARIDVPGLAWAHVAMGDIPSQLQTLDPKQPIAVYCHHGVRSLQVVAFLSRQGFDVVYNLAGGIDAWSREIDPSVPRY